tara:strand:- start:468 stop:707 length:240 start_codon:yes stop_codon:yes gene_type:complete
MSRGLTKMKCPFHANAKRSDIVAKLLEEDYYQPVAHGMIDIGEQWITELRKWYDTLTNKQLVKILMTDEHYGICWCEDE